jgi:hypothetical protein
VFSCLRADSADFVTHTPSSCDTEICAVGQCLCFEENKGDPMNRTLRRPRGVSPPLGEKNSVKPTTKKRTRKKRKAPCHERYRPRARSNARSSARSEPRGLLGPRGPHGLLGPRGPRGLLVRIRKSKKRGASVAQKRRSARQRKKTGYKAERSVGRLCASIFLAACFNSWNFAEPHQKKSVVAWKKR